MRRTIGPALALAFAFIIGGASAAVAADYRPVIFVPGLMGSTLQNDRGQEIWGSLKAADEHFEELAFPVDPKKDKVTEKKILEDFTAYLGWYKKPTYSPVTKVLKRLVGVGENEYIPFPYDWRQSNFDSACDLVKFISKRTALKQAAESAQGVVVVTHSMGGIVGRIFLDRYVPKDEPLPTECHHHYYVKLFMPIAAPFNGAGQSLRTFTDEVAFYWRFIRWDENKVLSVFFTIPSVYELLPRYPGCCVDTRDGASKPVDLFSFATWRANSWLPPRLENFRSDQIPPFIQERLNKAKELRDIMRRKVEETSPGTRVFALWGYNLKTATTVTLSQAAPKPRAEWSRGKHGDDTVPELSARHCEEDDFGKTVPCNIAPDLQAVGDKMWRFPNSHLGLLDDPAVHGSIRFGLDRYGKTTAVEFTTPTQESDVPDDLKPYLMSGPTGKSFGDAPLVAAEFVEPQRRLLPGTEQTVLVDVTGGDGNALPRADAGKLKVVASTSGGGDVPARIAATARDGLFAVTLVTPAGPDAVTVRVELPPASVELDNGKTTTVSPRIEEIFPVLEKTK